MCQLMIPLDYLICLLIAKAFNLFTSITGDKLAFDELIVKLNTIDLEPDISFVWFISLATKCGISL